jgi:transmembrane sensor
LLPDGSRVWLNAASSVRFPVAFTGKERRVEMTGECYFEVAKDPSRPFQVGIGVNTVEVLGTHFNINAYADEDVVATTLLEGAVKIETIKKETILRPGQQALIDKNGETKFIDAANLDEAVAWKNGLFSFHAMQIGPLMRQVSRWYDVQVRYEGNISYHFNATIERREDITKLLKLLEGTGNVHFTVEGKTITVKP